MGRHYTAKPRRPRVRHAAGRCGMPPCRLSASTPPSPRSPPTSGTPSPARQPLAHALLAALEDSGCVARAPAGRPATPALWDGDTLVAAMPLYLKAHSYGEYVFDWAWADAYQRHGLDYYPVARRPALHAGARPAHPRPRRGQPGALLRQVLAQVRNSGASSFHLLFPTDEGNRLAAGGQLEIRHGCSSHWQNAGYPGFDDFLARLAQPKRKKIRQERRKVAGGRASPSASCAGRIGPTTGPSSTPATPAPTPSTARRPISRWASSPTTPPARRLRADDRRARPASRWRRASSCDADALYGRYWGATEIHPLPVTSRPATLPGHRLRHRRRHFPLRGRRPGRTQAVARP